MVREITVRREKVNKERSKSILEVKKRGDSLLNEEVLEEGEEDEEDEEDEGGK